MINLEKETYSIREVAQKTGVSYQTANKWAHEGKLAHYLMGRTRKVSKADLEGFLAQSYQPVETKNESFSNKLKPE
jgi:excisionase family DNA binding protein